MPAVHAQHLLRYAAILRNALSRLKPFVPENENAQRLQVERGILFPMAILDPGHFDASPAERLVAPDTAANLPALSIVDCVGHSRPAYRGLLVYSWLQAGQLSATRFEQWKPALLAWCDALAEHLRKIDLPIGGAMPAAIGDLASHAAWLALPLYLAGKTLDRPEWLETSSAIFARLIHSQTPAGPFLLASRSDNPETNWYHELLILHAIASYAVHSCQSHLRESIFRNADFQQNETQPDHATNQPWALFAFLWNPGTLPLADQLLHAYATQNSQTPGVLALMLLADALYCIETILK